MLNEGGVLTESSTIGLRARLSEAWKRRGPLVLLRHRRVPAMGVPVRGKAALHEKAHAALSEAIALEGQGEGSAAATAFAQAITLLNRAGDRPGAARACLLSAQCALRLGHLDIAGEAADGARITFAALGNQAGEAAALRVLGRIDLRRGALQPARDHFDAALELLELTGDETSQATVLRTLGDIDARLGKVHVARFELEGALRLYGATQDVLGRARTLQSLGDLARSQGEPGMATQCYRQALPLMARLGDDAATAQLHLDLARLAADQADPDDALRHAVEATRLYELLDQPIGRAHGLYLTALASLQQRDVDTARVLARRAHDLYRAHHEDVLAQTVEALLNHLRPFRPVGGAEVEARG